MPGGSADPPAAAAAATPNAVLRQPMPTYDGLTSVTKWIRSFERWANTAGLVEANYKNVLENAFTADAARWYATRDSEDPDRSWDDLKQLLKTRFHAPMTAAETNRLLMTLKQANGESARVFADKVEAAMRQCREEINLPTANSAAGQANIDNTANSIFEFFGKMIFVQGLTESAKKEVCSRGVSSWTDCVQAAADAQAYKPAGASTRSISSLEDEKPPASETEEQLQRALIQQAIEVLTTRGRGGRGSRGGRGGGRGGRGRGNANGGSRPGWLRDNMLPPGTCFRCGHQGHIRPDCITRPENFKWDELAKQLNGGKQETAALQQEPQQSNQLALPAPQEDVASLAARQMPRSEAFRFPDF
jgi:hypothetical protein